MLTRGYRFFRVSPVEWEKFFKPVVFQLDLPTSRASKAELGRRKIYTIRDRGGRGAGEALAPPPPPLLSGKNKTEKIENMFSLNNEARAI